MQRFPGKFHGQIPERHWNLRGKEERNPEESGRSGREIKQMALEMQLKIGLGREVKISKISSCRENIINLTIITPLRRGKDWRCRG